MQTIKQLITVAGTGYQASIGGRMFLIQSCDAGDVLTVTLADLAGNQYSVQGVGAGFKAKPMAGFSSITITTTADANVQFIVSQGDVELQLSEVNALIANPPGAPANVQIQGQGTTSGNPLWVNVEGATLTATNVGINNTAANPVPVTIESEPGAPFAVSPVLAQTVAEPASVAVAASATGTVLVAADSTRRALRFYAPASNAGPVAITAVNTTAFAAATIVLNPGDFWNESDAPGAAWYAATGANTATVNIQTVKP